MTFTDFLQYLLQTDRSTFTVANTARQQPRAAHDIEQNVHSPRHHLPSNICARCLMQGHRARECTQPDTHAHTKGKTAAGNNTECPEGMQHAVVSATTFKRGEAISLPTLVNSIKTITLWDTGYTATFIREKLHHSQVVPEPDILKGSSGDTSLPTGAAQATISTSQATVINNLHYSVIIGLEWQETDHVEWFNSGIRQTERTMSFTARGMTKLYKASSSSPTAQD